MISREFIIGTNPVDADHKIYKRKTHIIDSGLTVLTGCNGSGKSTLLLSIKHDLKKNKIPVYYYDNLTDGGSYAIAENVFHGNYDLGAFGILSSEGENISLNIGSEFSKLRHFIHTGELDDFGSRLAKVFKDKDDDEIVSDERWILLDAVDSGYSIDNVVELKYVFNLMIEDAKKSNIDLFIVISANEYELCRDEKCYDVQSCKYIDIKSYDEYRDFIIKTRKYKDKNIDKAREKNNNALNFKRER